MYVVWITLIAKSCGPEACPLKQCVAGNLHTGKALLGGWGTCQGIVYVDGLS